MQTKTSFHHVFSHELYHRISQVRSSGNGAIHKAFTEKLEGLVDSKELLERAVFKTMADNNLSIEEAREEVHAEIFSSVVGQKEFYTSLAEGFTGSRAAGFLINRLVSNVISLNNISSKKFLAGGSPAFTFEGNTLIASENMKDIHYLVADMIGGESFVANGKGVSAHFGAKGIAAEDTKMFTPILGWRSVNELKGYLAKPAGWLQGAWKKIFPKGTKSYRDVMTSIEKILTSSLGWLKEHMPQGVFADLMADPKSTELASKVAHLGALNAAKAHSTVVMKHKDIFKNKTDAQLEKIHDDFVRGEINVTTKEGRLKAKRLGYSDEMIELFGEYKKISDDIHEKLLAIYPDLPKSATHYGQSIKWKKEDGTLLDDSFAAAVYPEASKLTGSKHFIHKKQKGSTKQIREAGKMKYKTINPHQMFLEYVNDASRVIALDEMITGGIRSNRARMYNDPLLAAKDGFKLVEDPAFENKEDVTTAEFRVKVAGRYLEGEKGGSTFLTREAAEKAAAALDEDFTIEETRSEPKTENISYVVQYQDEDGIWITTKRFPTERGASDVLNYFENKYPDRTYQIKKEEGYRLYFHKDLARMTRTLMKRDVLRGGSLFGLSGETAMDVKNQLTSVEFAFSMFHAFTISQELLAANSSWAFQRYKGQGAKKKLSGYRFGKGIQDATELSAMVKAIMQSPDLANDKAVQKKAKELLGTDSVDLLEMIDTYYMVGGLMKGQDPDLRSNIHNLAEMKYTKAPKEMKIKGAEAVFTSHWPSLTQMKTSMKEAHDEAVARLPDSPMRAMFQTVKFGALEGTTAWLMEQAIPKVKLSIWMKEYTLQLDRYKNEIADGTKTKHQIAHDTMKFVEDRFGEVNWKNQWMNPSYKTALQFMFRSFTWFTGSWKALTKAGVDIGKLGWFTVKDIGQAEDKKVKYQLTSKGMWGINAVIAHVLVSGLITAMYSIGAGVEGEVPDEEEVPLITKLLFPRIDNEDPTARISIPSYVTEAYKIFHHIGLMGTHAEPTKLISGRFNSILGNFHEVFQGEDFRGVSIVNEEDNLLVRNFDRFLHYLS